jgi:hypothetical protein
MNKPIYNTRAAYDIYVYYLALKRHFTSNYDFFKYNGKVKANAMSFENRKDKFFFYKLSRMREARDLILANMLEDPNMWIGEMMDDKAMNIYHEWAKRQQSLSYLFKRELSELDDDFDVNFIVDNGQHPKLLKLYTQRRISLETLVILSHMAKCLPYWSKNISDTIVFPSINNLIGKYKPFLNYDGDKMKKIVVDKFNTT